MAREIFRTGHAERNRVEAFSDGVLAIVITILVLEVRVPAHVEGGDAELWYALAQRVPVIFSWIVSFIFVLVFWVAHHYFFASLKRVDRGLLWINGLFLMAMSFIPFPTAFVGEYFGSKPPVILLAFVMTIAASAFSLIRWYASWPGDLLEDGAIASRETALRKSMLAPALYALATALAFFTAYIALLLIVVVPMLYFLPQKGR